MAEPRFSLAVRCTAGGFTLAVEATWDAAVAAVFGHSGAGKSVLLECIAGLRGAEGRIVLDGETILDTPRGISLPPQRRGVGWVPQESSLFPHLTVGENILFGARRGGTIDRAELDRILAILELQPLWQRGVDALSGGERQRVAMARALASRPRLLLLDEPLAALDQPLRARIHPYLFRLRDELRLPMLYVSHDPAELWGLAGHVLRLEGGALVAQGDPREVLWSAAATSEVGARENRLEGAVVEAAPGLLRVALAAGGELWVAGDAAPGQRVRVEFRAAEVLLAAQAPGPVSAQNVLEARVEAIEPVGTAVLVRLAAPMAIVAQVTARAAEALRLEPGRTAWAVLKAHACRAVPLAKPG